MIVVDASVWIEVLTGGLDIPELAEDDCHVPPHFDVEVIGSVRALHQRGAIDDAQADHALDQHLRASFERVFDPEDVRTAWKLRASMSFHDAWYVGMARRLNAVWVTTDVKAARTAKRLDTDVHVV